MCDSFIKYMLVEDSDTNKRKVEMKFPFDISTRENFNTFTQVAGILERNHKKMFILKNPYLARYFEQNKSMQFVDFVSIPCGHCPDCLNNRARDWVFRLMTEAKQWSNNWFITLTYDDEHLPEHGFLVKDEISKFNKKLKVYLERKGLPSDFRFYGVGEYGGEFHRPHYHVIYFNLQIPDLKEFGKTQSGMVNYISDFIADVWSKGIISIGEVDEASCAYVARYVDKKRDLTPEEKEKYKNIVDYSTGEVLDFVPEFSVMSRRPGIGAYYTESVREKILKEDYCLFVRGHKYKIPRYYEKKLEEDIGNYKQTKRINEMNFINSNLILSDNVDIINMKKEENRYRKHLKGVRNLNV